MKKIFAIALGVLALAACQREAQPVKTAGTREVKFTTTLNNYVVKAAEFEGSVQIFAGDPINEATDAAIDATNSALTPTTKIYWKDEQTATTTFGAYYPAPDTQEGVESAFTYDLVNVSVVGDEFLSTQDLEYHNKYLTAFAKDVTPETPVALNFSHPFAKLIISVENNKTEAISSIYLDGVPTKVDFDFAAGTAVTKDSRVTLVPTAQDDGSYVAIIAPATAQPVIRITVGNDTFVFALAAAVAFEANKVYTAEVSIPADAPAPTPGSEIAFGFTVTDWAETPTPLTYTDVTDVWYVSGTVYQGATAPATAWGEDIEMVKGGDGKYSVTVNYDETIEGDPGFLIHKVNYIQKLGLYEAGQMNIAYGYHLLVGGENIRIATFESEVATPVTGSITITLDPADNNNVTIDVN